MKLKEALKLPQEKLREPQLKNIPYIFEASELEVALEIINGVNDSKNIFYQADILERAHLYGWHKKEIPAIEKRDKLHISLVACTIFVLFISSVLLEQAIKKQKSCFQESERYESSQELIKRCSESNFYSKAFLS